MLRPKKILFFDLKIADFLKYYNICTLKITINYFSLHIT